MSRPLIGAIVLGHARPWLFSWIAEQYEALGGVVDITLDRPTPEVRAAAKVARLERPDVVRVFELSDADRLRKENDFLVLRNIQLTQIRERDPVFVAMHDDDCVWIDLDELRAMLLATPPGEIEHEQEVADGVTEVTRGPDLIYGYKRYLWDNCWTLNSRVFQARNVVAFRLLEGDRWPEGTNKIVHAPERVHDDPASKVYEMNSGLLDIGYMRRADRERVFKFYAKLGKMDASTTCLVTPQPTEPCNLWPELQNRMANLIPA